MRFYRTRFIWDLTDNVGRAISSSDGICQIPYNNLTGRPIKSRCYKWQGEVVQSKMTFLDLTFLFRGSGIKIGEGWCEVMKFVCRKWQMSPTMSPNKSDKNQPSKYIILGQTLKLWHKRGINTFGELIKTQFKKQSRSQPNTYAIILHIQTLQ